jgi:hypothetical protein
MIDTFLSLDTLRSSYAIHRSAWKGNSTNFAVTEFYEVHTILIDSLRVFSERASIVCLFGARRLSQHNLILSLPSPRKGAYPYDVRKYRTKSVDYFGTLRRAQTTRQPYSP